MELTLFVTQFYFLNFIIFCLISSFAIAFNSSSSSNFDNSEISSLLFLNLLNNSTTGVISAISMVFFLNNSISSVAPSMKLNDLILQGD